jgi:hypothetical protein
MCLIFQRFGGLRVSEETEIIGLDAAHWGTSNFGDDLEPPLVAVPGSRVAPHDEALPSTGPTAEVVA